VWHAYDSLKGEKYMKFEFVNFFPRGEAITIGKAHITGKATPITTAGTVYSP
jgi:hypothetical protein